MENQVGLMNEVPVDGCLVLGRDGPTYNAYNTRYFVDRKQRRAHVTKEILLNACIPCCKTANQSAVCAAVWSVLRSECFLLFLHMVVLCIGVSKECLNLRQANNSLHFAQSLVETMLAIAQMSIRIGSVWASFRNIKSLITAVEYVEEEVSVRGRALRKIVILYVGFGCTLIFSNLVLFIVFNHFMHLGWTMITNNGFIMLIGSGAAILDERLTFIQCQMQEDNVRLGLYETVLLLRESFMLRSTEDRQDYLARVERFLTAFSNTPYFRAPAHIHVLKQYVPDWNLYSSAEHVTVV